MRDPAGVDRCWCASWTSNPVWGDTNAPGEFDSHALPPYLFLAPYLLLAPSSFLTDAYLWTPVFFCAGFMMAVLFSGWAEQETDMKADSYFRRGLVTPICLTRRRLTRSGQKAPTLRPDACFNGLLGTRVSLPSRLTRLSQGNDAQIRQEIVGAHEHLHRNIPRSGSVRRKHQGDVDHPVPRNLSEADHEKNGKLQIPVSILGGQGWIHDAHSNIEQNGSGSGMSGDPEVYGASRSGIAGIIDPGQLVVPAKEIIPVSILGESDDVAVIK